MPRINKLTLLPNVPLLITESADEFDALRDAFEREIKPRGIVEQMYVRDISSIVWEILRLRRCKVVIINAAFRSALQELLVQVLRQPGQSRYDVEHDAQALALARPGEQGVELRAERLAHWRRDGRQFLRELVERVAQAEA